MPAGEIERFVVDQIRGIGSDPALVRETLAQAAAQVDDERAALEAERRGLHRDSRRVGMTRLRDAPGGPGVGADSTSLPRLADLQERLRLAEQRSAEIDARLEALDRERITEDEVAAALRTFDPVWNALSPREQARIVQLLVERVDYDGGSGTISVTFHPAGLKTLAAEQNALAMEKRA